MAETSPFIRDNNSIGFLLLNNSFINVSKTPFGFSSVLFFFGGGGILGVLSLASSDFRFLVSFWKISLTLADLSNREVWPSTILATFLLFFSSNERTSIPC